MFFLYSLENLQGVGGYFVKVNIVYLKKIMELRIQKFLIFSLLRRKKQFFYIMIFDKFLVDLFEFVICYVFMVIQNNVFEFSFVVIVGKIVFFVFCIFFFSNVYQILQVLYCF